MSFDPTFTARELETKQQDVVRRRRELFATNENAYDYAYWTGYENALADLRQILQLRHDMASLTQP